MNDKNLINYDILRNIQTVQESGNFVSAIDNILSDLFRVKNKNLDQVLSKSAGSSVSAVIKKILEEHKILSSDYSTTERILSKLKDEIKNLKVIKITLAIDPSDEIIDHMFDWVNQNIGQNILLDIEKDESILGGVILSIDGQYKDFSLIKTLKEVFVNKKTEIMNTFFVK